MLKEIFFAFQLAIGGVSALYSGESMKHPGVPPEQSMDIHDTGFACLALAAFAEARDQGPTGMALVVQTVINRIDHSEFPTDPCAVINAPGQFEGIYTWAYPREPWKIDRKSWHQALSVTQQVIDGTFAFPQECAGATHFLNPDLLARMPRWAAGHPKFKRTCRFQDHVFIRQIDLASVTH